MATLEPYGPSEAQFRSSTSNRPTALPKTWAWACLGLPGLAWAGRGWPGLAWAGLNWHDWLALAWARVGLGLGCWPGLSIHPENQTTRQQPDNQTPREPDNQTTRQQPDNQTTRQPDNQTTGQPDNQTTRQPDKDQNCASEGPYGSKVAILSFSGPEKLKMATLEPYGPSEAQFWSSTSNRPTALPKTKTSLQKARTAPRSPF